MKKLRPEQQDSSLNKYLALSFLAHTVFILVFTIQAYFFPSEPIEYLPSVRVDIVDLPDKQDLTSPQPAAATPQKTEEAPTPPKEAPPLKTTEEEIALKPAAKPEPKKNNRKQEQQALEKLAQMAAIEKLKQKPTSTYKGNVISPGTQLTGVVRLQAERYYGEVDSHIRSQWFLPAYLRNKDLQTVVIVKFRATGQLAKVQIVESSGNATFDDLVLATIQRATPVPAPPENLRLKVLHDGFRLRFSE